MVSVVGEMIQNLKFKMYMLFRRYTYIAEDDLRVWYHTYVPRLDKLALVRRENHSWSLQQKRSCPVVDSDRALNSNGGAQTDDRLGRTRISKSDRGAGHENWPS
jgi:hypothetical protein